MVTGPVDPRFAQVSQLFFVIGAQKCGTTWLHRYLAHHPKVCVPVHKETNYWRAVHIGPNYLKNENSAFSRKYREIVQPSLRVRLNRLLKPASRPEPELVKSLRLVKRALGQADRPHAFYADLLFQKKTQQTRAVGEVCPQYALLSEQTYREMAGLAENVGFVFIMRDPAARAISAIKHGLRSRLGRQYPIDESILADAISEGLHAQRGWGFDKTHYHKTLATLESAVPSDRIHLMFYETMFDDAEIGRMNAFLGITPHQADYGLRANADTAPGLAVDPGQRRALAMAFADVYAAMSDRFGDALPAAWRDSMALAAEAGVKDA